MINVGSLELLSISTKPIFITDNVSYLLDTDSDIPIFCGSLEDCIKSGFKPERSNKTVDYNGVGGSMKSKIYRLYNFCLSDKIVFTYLDFVCNSSLKNNKFNFILSSSMFKRIDYTISNRDKKIYFSVQSISDCVGSLSIYRDKYGNFNVLYSSSEDSEKDLAAYRNNFRGR